MGKLIKRRHKTKDGRYITWEERELGIDIRAVIGEIYRGKISGALILGILLGMLIGFGIINILRLIGWR